MTIPEEDALKRAVTLTAFATVASAILANSSPALGQGPESGAQTKFEFIDQSMEQLLNNGYEIKTTVMGQFILDKPGTTSQAPSWIVCSLGVTEGQMEQPKAQKSTSSTCFALN